MNRASVVHEFLDVIGSNVYTERTKVVRSCRVCWRGWRELMVELERKRHVIGQSRDTRRDRCGRAESSARVRRRRPYRGRGEVQYSSIEVAAVSCYPYISVVSTNSGYGLV
jgi:hypothetical protein